MKKLLWYLVAGTRGGVNRARIIKALYERPYNANQLSKLLDLDYKTVTHHLKILEKNYVISVEGNGYGKMAFLDDAVAENYDEFLKIWDKIKLEEK